jgi:hypothetical protein
MATGFSESGSPVFAEPVPDWAGMTTYLLKEATPQPQFLKGFRRIDGSIPLGARVLSGVAVWVSGATNRSGFGEWRIDVAIGNIGSGMRGRAQG